ncbi:TPA: porin family protein [Legionella pneumophila]|uniref:outer membrane protein n=3 Tax=Legionella pneumophila TaxID=446 RepID=UPI000E02D656|nr:outer membrane beta-barrel protein [Legionella pneumophila]STY12529.1 Opacity protein and related surface antigens [Legionella pneumophila]STY13622.1 Opacity protein and related surface antigens [Legionella pneumophila]STY13853.1 Opacity protein and related surface antigens [Legionella pneumophila]HAT1762786.1 porin family protein [Legionella pneumophila]HAT1767570.1 porin family protein [Legionella pneumophila]
MKYRLFLFITAAGVLGSTAFAGTMGPAVPSKDWTWVSSIAAGPVWARGGETQTFFLAPEIEKTYAARKSTNVLASGELFVGIQKTWSSQWLGQLGLAAATTGNAKLQGVIWDDADPEFNNHSYQYKIRNSRIAVKGKLLLDKGYWLMPWVSASLGVGFNRAHEYSNAPLIFEALPNPNFADHTKTAFTYTLGAGVQKAFNDHWQVGIGYEFADWGKSELGRADMQTMNSGLALNHLYTNGVLLNLTYVA